MTSVCFFFFGVCVCVCFRRVLLPVLLVFLNIYVNLTINSPPLLSKTVFSGSLSKTPSFIALWLQCLSCYFDRASSLSVMKRASVLRAATDPMFFFS